MDIEMLTLAGGQHGLVTRRQLVELGLSPRQIELRLERGLLKRVQPAVYRVAGAVETWEQRLTAAVLGSGGGVASHRAAGGLWRLPGVPAEAVEVTIAGTRRPRLSDVVVHRTDRLDRQDVATQHNILVTSPARTLLDLGAVLPEARVEEAVEVAIAKGLVTVARLQEARDRLGVNGRRGVAALGALLDRRAAEVAAAESPLEVAMVRLLRSAGLPDPVRQHALLGGRVRIDLAYPQHRVAIELDGRQWHQGGRQLERDDRRQNLIVGQGWRVLRYTWSDLRERPEAVVAEVHAARFFVA